MLHMKLTPEDRVRFYTQIEPLLGCEQVRQMEDYIQHGDTSCLQHCIAVSYYSYMICKRFGLTKHESALIRGALLHDFFLYDWHDKQHRFHGFTHPRTALENAESFFELDDRERDIISRHMWPLTVRLPRYRETMIVSLVDKYCSVFEFFCPLLGNSYSRLLLYRRGKVGL